MNLLVVDSKYPCTVECFPRFCFDVKTSADKMILHIFDLFSHEFSLFSTQLTFLRPNNSIGFEKRLKSYEKISKICKIIKSADVFTAKQNLGKHSTVHCALVEIVFCYKISFFLIQIRRVFRVNPREIFKYSTKISFARL